MVPTAPPVQFADDLAGEAEPVGDDAPTVAGRDGVRRNVIDAEYDFSGRTTRKRSLTGLVQRQGVTFGCLRG